jgi:hypothetical protein
MCNHTQQVKCIYVPGIGHKQLTVEGLCLAKPALLMKRDSLLET